MITKRLIIVIMIRTQISLNSFEYSLAKGEAKRMGISLAEMLRIALRKLLPISKDKPWMRYNGFIQSGDPHASRKIDELIYGQKD